MTDRAAKHRLGIASDITIPAFLISVYLIFFLGEASQSGELELTPAVQGLLTELAAETEVPFSASRGKTSWFQELDSGRSCTSCHTKSLEVRGRHQKTGKIIEPMARSINPSRLTERKKIKKWFLRNCKWTYGRVCTAQEKGDILLWLSSQ